MIRNQEIAIEGYLNLIKVEVLSLFLEEINRKYITCNVSFGQYEIELVSYSITYFQTYTTKQLQKNIIKSPD
ncbi:hypothetical protein [Anditalea andensis]|uniref:Uncharacterized protein n=1 Tax=Anditalea andensis TaxID=1048983 RepID=A0A074LIS6_9BACT|nr:hypothetical protein [Anditalea andensis]KEO73677.1 hypothetical protein EL17_11090 [Anditalea andensis]